MSDEELAYILSKMVFPEVNKDSRVHCELTVTMHGSTDNERCFSNIKPSAKYTKFYRRLKRTLTTAELQPAYRNGRPVEVNMQFSFVFLSENKSEYKLVKNDGRLWGQLGVDYVAPQRLTQITPYSCPEFTRIKHKCKKQGISYFYVWDVDTTGLGTNCRAISTTKEDVPGIDHCERKIKFIPGTVKGERVLMPFVESFGFKE
ncbi:MAG: hypothetical protein HKN70_06655 [Gammaproteobacteria bacterium]|nr:hypothetical protein [Gammaproteobacteria bacterium]